MSNEELKIKLDQSSPNMEAVIRHGNALEEIKPQQVLLFGDIETAYRYLLKRKGIIDLKKCHICVDKDEFSIELIVDEQSSMCSRVFSRLEESKVFENFGINSGKMWTTFELADFIKMHRAYFEKPSYAMELVSILRNFRAKVDNDVEKIDDRRGNSKMLVQQVVESNLPESFNVVLPIFRGRENQTLEIEVYVNAENFNCTLISADAQEKIHRSTSDVIEKQILAIEDMCPELVIYYI